MRGLHGSLKDIQVEKRITGQNALHQILEHDRDSLLLSNISQTSYDYVGPERRKQIGDELDKVQPFSTSRPKVSFKEQDCNPIFGRINLQKVEKFINMKKRNFNRNCSQKGSW